MSVIYLIRHGQASFSSADYDQLSDLGIKQSQILGESLKLRQPKPKSIESGTLKRHRDTAHHSLSKYGTAPKLTVNSGWNEYDHQELIYKHNPDLKDFESLRVWTTKQDNPMQSIQQLLNNSVLDWITDKHAYVESWMGFKNRVYTTLDRLANELAKGEDALIYTSGGPISLIIMRLLELKDEQFIDLQHRLVNSSITKIQVGRNGCSLLSYNEHGHLEYMPELVTFR